MAVVLFIDIIMSLRKATEYEVFISKIPSNILRIVYVFVYFAWGKSKRGYQN